MFLNIIILILNFKNFIFRILNFMKSYENWNFWKFCNMRKILKIFYA